MSFKDYCKEHLIDAGEETCDEECPFVENFEECFKIMNVLKRMYEAEDWEAYF